MANRLTEVLSELGRARKALLAESHQAGDRRAYADARTLMELAEKTDRLSQEVAVLISGSAGAERGDTRQAAEKAEEPAPTPGKSRFPQFFVRGDALVKRGLQRGGEDVYEHAVPRARWLEILEVLGGKAASSAERQRPFSIAQIQRQLHCPPYMTYVVVSTMLHQGLLQRARKGSYTFAAPDKFLADAATLWEQLKGGSDA